MKEAKEFKEQATKNNIKEWRIHDCSICGYPCGYIFEEDRVLYDSGCDCSYGGESLRDWDDVAEHYNMQTNEDVIKKMNLFWGFKE